MIWYFFTIQTQVQQRTIPIWIFITLYALQLSRTRLDSVQIRFFKLPSSHLRTKFENISEECNRSNRDENYPLKKTMLVTTLKGFYASTTCLTASQLKLHFSLSTGKKCNLQIISFDFTLPTLRIFITRHFQTSSDFR